MRSPAPREIPKGDPVNMPGGDRLPGVTPVKDAKSPAELRKEEKASQKKHRGLADGAPNPKAKPGEKKDKKGRR